MNPDDPLGLITPPKQNSADPLGLVTHHNKPKIGQMGHAITTDESEPDPTYGQKVAGGLASFGRDIPGVEAAQAGARSFMQKEPYSEALSDIRKAEDSAGPLVKNYNSLAGGTVAALAGPKGTFMSPMGKGGSAAVQAARFGAAQGALSADPMSNEDRILKAGRGGAIAGAVGGVIGDTPTKVAQVTRVLAGKTPGAAALARRAEISAADAAYPAALAQGKGLTHPDVTTALDSPYLKPYTDAVRASPSNAGADDATILHKTYTRLSTRQRALENLTEHAADYRAGPEQEIQDIELAKKQLLDAADKIMPGYRPAVTQHAQMAEALDALKNTKDATQRIMNNSNVAGRNLEKNSPEAFKASIIKMKKDEALAAREAVLGQLHQGAPSYLNARPWKGFGLPSANTAINRVSPYLQMIEDQIGGQAPVASQNLPVTQSSGVLRRALAVSLGGQASR